jgi:hypothetical protein
MLASQCLTRPSKTGRGRVRRPRTGGERITWKFPGRAQLAPAKIPPKCLIVLERAMGFELTTPTLARRSVIV